MTPYHQRILDYADVCDAFARLQMARIALRPLAQHRQFASLVSEWLPMLDITLLVLHERRDELQAELTNALDERSGDDAD